MANQIALADEGARKRITDELDTNFLVEAAAGTGKTTSLVNRMVSLVIHEKCKMRNIAAVTFTRKAASHLAEKFQEELEKSFRKAKESTGIDEGAFLRCEILEEALEEFHQTFIGTIHSFCGRLIRERPIEAGIDPEFEEIDEVTNVEIRERCWEEYKRDLYLKQDNLLERLHELGIQFEPLKATYRVISDYPEEQPVVKEDLKRPDLSEARERISTFLRLNENEIPQGLADDKRDRCQIKLIDIISRYRNRDMTQDPEFISILESFPKYTDVTLNRWPSKDKAKEIKIELQAISDELIHPLLNAWREYLHPILVKAVQPAVENFRLRRLDEKRLNFNDLLIIARDLLRDHPEVRQYFKDRYTHLLVDEFQDTDPIQAEIMMYLTGQDCNEMDWKKLVPDNGSLFVVGDPKQSIYRFRRADITIYNKVKEIITSNGGELLTLNASFRSLGKVCTWSNKVFEDVFPEYGDMWQAGHVNLTPFRQEGNLESGVFRLDIHVDRFNTSLLQEDAERIAEWIDLAVKEGFELEVGKTGGLSDKKRAEYGDFLIVLYNTTKLDIYAKVLESKGIPFDISGGKGFSQSFELTILQPFLRALKDPSDELNVFAYLRGPLCGIDDDTLYHFREQGSYFNYQSGICNETPKQIADAFEKLRRARKWTLDLSPGVAMEKIIKNLGIIPWSFINEDGESRSGNIVKALSIIRNMSVQGYDFEGIVEKLEQILSEQNIEGMNIDPSRQNSVRLMNLHKVKGLEAPVVFLAGPHGTSSHDPTYYIERSSEPPQGHFLISQPNGWSTKEVARPFDWDSNAKKESPYQDAEKDRLLYVAATRARNMLVVSFASNGKRYQSPWGRFNEYIQEPLPDIQFSGVKEVRKTTEAEPLDLSDLQDLKTNLERTKESASVPSYSLEKVTALIHSRSEGIPFSENTGKGYSWGNVIHGMLERMVNCPKINLERTASYLLELEEREVSETGELVDLMKKIQKSDIWQRVVSASEKYTEVPFTIKTTKSDIESSDDGPENMLVQGVIDLVFREDGKWVIVDYKSDQGNDINALSTYYSPQVRLYKRYWEQITGDLAEGYLFFVNQSLLVKV